MGWLGGTVVYVILWWLVLFMVLPWGARAPKTIPPGFATSAPEKPRMWLKAAITTVIAAILWAVFHAVHAAGLITFRAG